MQTIRADRKGYGPRVKQGVFSVEPVEIVNHDLIQIFRERAEDVALPVAGEDGDEVRALAVLKHDAGVVEGGLGPAALMRDLITGQQHLQVIVLRIEEVVEHRFRSQRSGLVVGINFVPDDRQVAGADARPVRGGTQQVEILHAERIEPAVIAVPPEAVNEHIVAAVVADVNGAVQDLPQGELRAEGRILDCAGARVIMPRLKGQDFVQRAVALFDLLEYIQAVGRFDYAGRVHLTVDVVADGGVGVQVNDVEGQIVVCLLDFVVELLQQFGGDCIVGIVDDDRTVIVRTSAVAANHAVDRLLRNRQSGGGAADRAGFRGRHRGGLVFVAERFAFRLSAAAAVFRFGAGRTLPLVAERAALGLAAERTALCVLAVGVEPFFVRAGDGLVFHQIVKTREKVALDLQIVGRGGGGRPIQCRAAHGGFGKSKALRQQNVALKQQIVGRRNAAVAVHVAGDDDAVGVSAHDCARAVCDIRGRGRVQHAAVRRGQLAARLAEHRGEIRDGGLGIHAVKIAVDVIERRVVLIGLRLRVGLRACIRACVGACVRTCVGACVGAVVRAGIRSFVAADVGRRRIGFGVGEHGCVRRRFDGGGQKLCRQRKKQRQRQRGSKNFFHDVCLFSRS